MMGILISGSLYVYGNNTTVVHNTSRPESVIRKKAIQYAIMQSMNQLPWVSPLLETYPAKNCCRPIMTKVLYGQKRKNLVSNNLSDIHDEH